MALAALPQLAPFCADRCLLAVGGCSDAGCNVLSRGRARLRSRPILANRKIRQQIRQSRTSVTSSPSIGSSTCASHPKEKRHGLENTSHRRDRCRHGNQHLCLRRPVIFAASQPHHSQGPSPSRPSSWEPPPVAASRSGTRTPKRVAGRVPATPMPCHDVPRTQASLAVSGNGEGCTAKHHHRIRRERAGTLKKKTPASVGRRRRGRRLVGGTEETNDEPE